MNLRTIVHLVSILTALLGTGIFLCVPVGYLMGDAEPVLRSMTGCGAGLILAGLAAAYFSRGSDVLGTGLRDGFAVVALGWFAAVLAGAVPYIGVAGMSVADSVFESASGFSTTGASVVDSAMHLRDGKTLPDGIESLPYCILFWRSLTNWLGGMGIVVFALVILPFLGVSGQQLYNAEIPGLKTESDKFAPRAAFSAKIIWAAYLGITCTEALLLYFAGMAPFDSVCHSFSTIATGGFSTKNASIAYYSSPYIQWVIAIFMLIASCNFSLHFRALFTRKWNLHFKDEEFRVFMLLVLAASATIAAQLYLGGEASGMGNAVRCATFQVASIISSTGFTTANYALWPTFPMMILFFLMFIGGCAGSTAGGMKCVRALVFFKHAKSEIVRCIFPRALSDIRLNGERLEGSTVSKTTAFMLSYVFIFALIALLLPLLCEMDMPTAFSASIACLSNIGPGFSLVGPSCTYGWMNAPAKLLLSFAMVLGRLELYAILVVFLPSFWRK